jgi:hypothetical protein
LDHEWRLLRSGNRIRRRRSRRLHIGSGATGEQFDLAAKTPVGFSQGHLDRFEMPPESLPLTVSGIAIPPGTAVQLCYRAQQLDRLFVPERRYVVVGGVRLTGNVNFDCGRFQFGSLFEETVVRGRPLPRCAAILHDDVLSPPTR